MMVRTFVPYPGIVEVVSPFLRVRLGATCHTDKEFTSVKPPTIRNREDTAIISLRFINNNSLY